MKARILVSLLEIMIGRVFFCAVLGVLSQEVHVSEAQQNNANAKHVTQTKLFGDDIKSWLTPDDGVLATENTPVYGVVEKSKISKKDAGYEIIEYKDAMKDALAYLRENKSYAIITPSNIPPNASLAKNTVVGNQNPVRLKTMNDKNRKSTSIFPMNQMTSYSSLPYPTIVYPEILVIVDNALFKKLGSNVRDVVIHILAFWNGVDLLFRNLESPKFRFNIEAIVIVEAPNVFTNVEYAPNKTDAYQLKRTIDSWLYSYQREFPIDSYDIAAFMTSNDLFRKSGKRLGGISYNTGACKTFHESKRVVKSAYVHEAGDFFGIRLMAHELGHLLGISHDGYDAKRCPVKDGTIMTSNGFDLGPKFYEWSQCSLDKLTQSFVKNNLNCLYNEIYEHSAAVPRILPGKLMDLDKQCHFQRANSTPVIKEDNCKHFRCRTNLKPPFYKLFSLSIGLLDGTSCGQGKMCLLGSCVQENLINDPSIYGKKV
ncbi:A disintegrin and metalloproteinase with thrombospondin motifs like [Microplitis mediator]|uniref:A disintegrin and metalloproteinase with thrombospondin motifs like n=1 Tax=Microplitis mediator TaxID=375433 RepID=UPI002552DE02|nr:A disintegrin and metalloproteinase with thrombospondin motifs like [Microplitis mediator]XP_057321095.1 A disintegrin and metalloproteinase with thrombospondin motifs like [Microplitis mediator]XP_057321096.1 A disintegrin and metalloproteinase with thrombospondin motifs like [Microplitis mediator]XP_057321097.1 A disintegrin and metalloproteinase with thrombospondin motifs like [Microplitis mediator]XP_057321098.1 A disintegrin and metalloproteinase with thrombospondin motifs like [Micropl